MNFSLVRLDMSIKRKAYHHLAVHVDYNRDRQSAWVWEISAACSFDAGMLHSYW